MPVRRRCTHCRISQKSCDTRRPKCGRCKARSITCIYQPTNEFVFIDQNRTSADLSRRASRRTKRVSRSIDLSLHLPGAAQSCLSNESSPGWQLQCHVRNFCNQPLWSLDDRVLARFFSRWAARQTFLSWQPFIPTLYENSGQESAMYFAILAAAYADLAVVERHGDRSLRSYQAYVETLRRIQLHIDEPNAAMSDTIFAAVLVIDSFELLYMVRPTSMGVHTQAIARLLELHRQNCSNDQLKSALGRAAYPRIQARQLLCYVPSLSKCIRDFARVTDNEFDVRISNFVAAACDMLALLKTERAKSTSEQSNSQRLQHLSVLLWGLMKDGKDWLDRHQTIPRLKRITLTIHEDSDWPSSLARSTILVPERLWHARNWLLYHMCCINISSALVELQNDEFFRSAPLSASAMPSPIPETQTHLATLNESCQFVLDTAPFITGLANEHGFPSSLSLNDTGLLVIYYPLWAIVESQNTSAYVDQQAAVLLQFMEERRKIICPQ